MTGSQPRNRDSFEYLFTAKRFFPWNRLFIFTGNPLIFISKMWLELPVAYLNREGAYACQSGAVPEYAAKEIV
jgi:hypothetical protein